MPSPIVNLKATLPGKAVKWRCVWPWGCDAIFETIQEAIEHEMDHISPRSKLIWNDVDIEEGGDPRRGYF